MPKKGQKAKRYRVSFSLAGIQMSAVTWALFMWMKANKKRIKKNKIIRFQYNLVRKQYERMMNRYGGKVAPLRAPASLKGRSLRLKQRRKK